MFEVCIAGGGEVGKEGRDCFYLMVIGQQDVVQVDDTAAHGELRDRREDPLSRVGECLEDEI